MTSWIYNMGLSVPISTVKLQDKRIVQPLSKSAKNSLPVGSEQEGNEKAAHSSQLITDAYERQRSQNSHRPVSQAQEIMSTDILTLPTTMRLSEAWQLFLEHRFRHFPVLDAQQKLIGILSDRDMLLYLSLGKKNSTVGQLMKTPVLSASGQTAIRELCEVMFNQHIGALPITDDQSQLQGIVTRSDILRSMIEHGPVQLWV